MPRKVRSDRKAMPHNGIAFFAACHYSCLLQMQEENLMMKLNGNAIIPLEILTDLF